MDGKLRFSTWPWIWCNDDEQVLVAWGFNQICFYKSQLLQLVFSTTESMAAVMGLVDSLWRNHSKLKDRTPVSQDNWETRIVYGSLLVRSGHSKFETRNLWSICFRVNIDQVFWKARAWDRDCIGEQKGFLRWQALGEYTKRINRNSIGSNRSNSLGTDIEIRVTFLRTQPDDERKEPQRSIHHEELSISSL